MTKRGYHPANSGLSTASSSSIARHCVSDYDAGCSWPWSFDLESCPQITPDMGYYPIDFCVSREFRLSLMYKPERFRLAAGFGVTDG